MLDLYAGTGSVAIAAAQLGRNSISLERVETQTAYIKGQLQKLSEGPSLQLAAVVPSASSLPIRHRWSAVIANP